MERSVASASAAAGRKIRSKSAASGNLDRLDAAGAGNLKVARKAAPEPDVGHDLLGAPVLVQHLGPAGGSQRPVLLGLLAQIDRARSQFQVEFDRLPFQFAYLEFHTMSLRRGVRGVNAEGATTTGRTPDGRG